MGGQEDVLHGRLENALIFDRLVRIRCWPVQKEG
jgi:hypothetical protein